MPPKKTAAKAPSAPAAAPAAKPAAKPTAAAAKPAAAPAKAAAVDPPPAPEPRLSLAQLEAKIKSVTAAKEANATVGKALDEKLTRAFKTAPKRPTMAVDKLVEEMERLELRRSTTSMSLNDEKYILRELQLLQERKLQVEEYDKFQKWVDATRTERNERFAQNRKFEEQLQQLQRGVRRAALSEALRLPLDHDAFVTVEMDLPEDKIGSVVGKGFANARKIEADCGVLLDIPTKSTLLKITSTPANVARAQAAIENITLATTHAIGLHPDTVKVLMAQKAKNLLELETKLGLKLDLNKADGTLTTTAAPAAARQLEKAIKELEEGKVEIQLPAEIVPKLIGKKGETINQLMEDTGCLVDIDKVTNAVRLCGTKESVGMAKAFVLALIEDQSQRAREFSAHDRGFFPSPDYATFKFHFFAEFLMGNKGHQLKLLRTDASDAKIRIAKDQHHVHVVGTKTQLLAMEEALRERVREFEAHHWLYEVADTSVLSVVIGKKGSTIKEIEDAGKDAHVKVDIQGRHVCVFGDSGAAIEQARATILSLVAANQRSSYTASSHLIGFLFTNKRAKLNEIEASSRAKINVPPAVAKGGDATVKISLTGTLEAITAAKSQLETLDESHLVQFWPLDDDEVPTIIGKKGETISELEKKSGARLRVLRGDKDKDKETPAAAAAAELEMVGTQEQLAIVQRELDALLQTQHRELLQLDAFATGCLIGKKGERIKTLRLAHPDATLDAFPVRGQVRVKAATREALQACVDHVLKELRETQVVESVRVATASSTTFHSILDKQPLVQQRLQELEAEGSAKVTIQDDGKLARIRGPATSIGAIKAFLEMLLAMATGDATQQFVETIPLPVAAFGSVLLAKADAAKLNDNALRIATLTSCEIRVKKAAVVIEGATPAKVYDAKDQVHKVLQFYHGECMHTLDKLPSRAVARLYELLPSLRSRFHVVFSLPSTTSLRVFADSKHAVKQIVALLQQELAAWKQQHVELPIAAWLVPVLVGKNGETINKLSAESHHAKLDLSPSTGTSEDRVLTISARDDASVTLAVANVQAFLQQQQHRTSTFTADRSKLGLVNSVKKDVPSGVQFHVVHVNDQVQVVLFGGEHEAREAVVEKLEHLVATTVFETIALPPQATGSIVGALIGKSGANIKALQKEFPLVAIDIKREANTITLKGPQDDVYQVKNVMEDKVQELARQQAAFEEKHRVADEERRQQRRAGPAAASGEGEEKKKKPAEDDESEGEEEEEEESKPAPRRTGPVGGSGAVEEAKLTKNQRRRLRRRAENEKNSDVLSMIMGGGSVGGEPKKDEAEGYYHSASGYKLRL